MKSPRRFFEDSSKTIIACVEYINAHPNPVTTRPTMKTGNVCAVAVINKPIDMRRLDKDNTARRENICDRRPPTGVRLATEIYNHNLFSKPYTIFVGNGCEQTMYDDVSHGVFEKASRSAAISDCVVETDVMLVASGS